MKKIGSILAIVILLGTISAVAVQPAAAGCFDYGVECAQKCALARGDTEGAACSLFQCAAFCHIGTIPCYAGEAIIKLEDLFMGSPDFVESVNGKTLYIDYSLGYVDKNAIGHCFYTDYEGCNMELLIPLGEPIPETITVDSSECDMTITLAEVMDCIEKWENGDIDLGVVIDTINAWSQS